ncbi:MAG: hypothetical protein WDN03_16335 [Rhizomicrobium sp.]
MDLAALAAGLRYSGLAIGLWSLLSTLEWFAQLRAFAPGGLLAWDVLALRPGRLYQNDWAQKLYSPTGMIAILSVRLAAALVLLVAPGPQTALLALTATIAMSLLMALRLPVSDGADKMGMVAACGAALAAAGVLRQDWMLGFAGVLWSSGQLALAYVMSGYVKLISRGWRDGSVLLPIMSTHSQGAAWAARAVAAVPRLALPFSWLVIVTELLFPLALMLPFAGLVTVLAFFALFHFAIACIMGLNTYFWAFVATYPSVVILSTVLRRSLGLG